MWSYGLFDNRKSTLAAYDRVSVVTDLAARLSSSASDGAQIAWLPRSVPRNSYSWRSRAVTGVPQYVSERQVSYRWGGLRGKGLGTIGAGEMR